MPTPPHASSPPRAQRGDLGAILLGLGALLLFISLFLHWYQPNRSAWAVFEVWDLVLAGLAGAAALAALGQLGIARGRSERWTTAHTRARSGDEAGAPGADEEPGGPGGGPARDRR